MRKALLNCFLLLMLSTFAPRLAQPAPEAAAEQYQAICRRPGHSPNTNSSARDRGWYAPIRDRRASADEDCKKHTQQFKNHPCEIITRP